MKNIFKFLFLLTFIAFVSCNNEDQELLTISAAGTGEITAPATGTSYVLNPEEELTNTIITLTWNNANYGVPTAVNYIVEFAKAGTSFAEPFLAGSTSNTFMSWNITEFNGAAVSSGLTPFIEEGLDIRITSTVGSLKSTPQVSESITVYVTPFTTDLPKISVPGNHQGWDPATAPTLAASGFGQTDYEGYAWLDGEFKFTAPNELGNFNWDLNWGDDGSYTGKLAENASDNCKADDTGYYFIKADTEKLTYSATPVNWGIIGAATPTGWDSDTDLIYDAATRTLSVDINLIAGSFKFRGNNEWGAFDLGTEDADGILTGGGDLTFDGSEGNYHVVLDLSNPREYTYSVTAN
tara:strand:+ start:5669 stop:6724 length:1056 start_codon:yes stop_codon:yes gene_type:complete